MTEISVVMGVYNDASTVRETVESILAQQGVDLEVVVVDDGSTDDTPAVLATYPQVRVIRQENRGLTRALITGCAAARGDLIARHDSDDLSHPRRMAIQKQMFDDPEVVFVSCATQYIGPEGEPLWISRPYGVAITPAHILDPAATWGLIDRPTAHGSVMFRRDAYERAGGYRGEFYYGQDYDLWYRLATLGKFQTTDEVLYTARVTPDSISGLARSAQQKLAELSRAALHARLHGEPETSILAEAGTITRARGGASPASGLYFIGEALRRNGDLRARAYLRKAIIARPFWPRPWIRYIQSLLST